MSNIGCAFNLELLLHAYYSGAPHPSHASPAAKSGRAHLHRHGLIDREDQFASATEKGKFFIGHLLSVQLPQETFFIPPMPQAEAG